MCEDCLHKWRVLEGKRLQVGRQLNKNKLDKHAKKAESLEEENARLKVYSVDVESVVSLAI